MEDLIECSVCFEMYKTSGDKVPRVFPCEHTFCHSCIESLVSKNRVSCPVCRHSHKCTDVSRLPRNLTLLKLLELEKSEKFDKQTQCENTQSAEKGIQCKYTGSKSKATQAGSTTFKYCAKCRKNTVFCQTCCDGNLRMCTPCFQYHLHSELQSVETILDMTEGLHHTITETENHWKQADTYLKDITSDIRDGTGMPSGHSYEIQVMTNALIESNIWDFKGITFLLRDANLRIGLFAVQARNEIRRHRSCLRKSQLSCSMRTELANLKEECAFYYNENANAKVTALHRSFIIFEILKSLGYNMINGPREEPLWYTWSRAAKNLTFCVHSLIALFIVCIILDIGTSTDSWFPLATSTWGLGQLGPVLIVFIGLGLGCCKVITCKLSTIPPVYNRNEDRRKLKKLVEKFERQRQTIFQEYLRLTLVSIRRPMQ